jgi:hypothetical protein
MSFLKEQYAAMPDLISAILLKADSKAVEREILEKIQLIQDVPDTSAFMGHVLFRAYHLAKKRRFGSARVLERIPKTLLSLIYRDFPPDSTAWHRSENLRMCYSSLEMLVGEYWPRAEFSHDGRSAREHFLVGRQDSILWTDWIGVYGFGEWDSPSYYGVNLMTLFNVFDFSKDPEMRRRAEWILDKLILDLSLRWFHGLAAGSHGRCYYDDLLEPRTSLISNVIPFFFEPEKVWAKTHQKKGELLILEPFLVSTSYRPPKIFQKILSATFVHKQRNRVDDRYRPTPSVPNPKNLNLYHDIPLSTYRTRDVALSSFQHLHTGLDRHELIQEFASQLHAWQATLSNGASIFVTNPGSTDPRAKFFGFWIGQKSFPAIIQYQNILITVYDLDPKSGGLPYTHAFFPTQQMDEFLQKGPWLLGRVGKGYVALRSAKTLSPSQASSGSEFISESSREAWVCVVGNQSDHGSFESFSQKVVIPTRF